MADIGWLIRRLKAMSIPEILWRVSQKGIQKQESKLYKDDLVAVSERVFSDRLKKLQPTPEMLFLNYENRDYVAGSDIYLHGGYPYQQYKKEWNAGFQTEAVWPNTFSYSLEYKQRDDIGDARTNWELNRHYQLALLAKNYYASGDKKYLGELVDLFTDWNGKNPFLHGISWTSVMEVAIRASNWSYAYAFLAKSHDVPGKLMEQLRIGILNMTDYIAAHYSRYSSANNHLIVETYAIGQSGILFQYQPWIDMAVSILTRELPLQNYSDGVNKELSLHYQSFYMEAMGLMMRLLKKSGQPAPDTWEPMLDKMCHYLSDCIGEHGEVVEFGDNDEGKILDLHGGEENHYEYVLSLLSCLLDTRYIDLGNCTENLKWLFTEDEIAFANKKPIYKPVGSVTYKEGGNTILRSKDGRVIVGIDHAALGFGSIAAHGHADALSFQMYMDGQPVFVDPGTYIYHCDLNSRNAFRRTENHNTVCIGGKDQSEMLGAFLWGRKAECKLLKSELGGVEEIIEAEQNGYAPGKHSRKYVFSDKSLKIIDSIKSNGNWTSSWIFGSDDVLKKQNEQMIDTGLVIISWDIGDGTLLPIDISDHYGTKKKAKKLVLSGHGDCVLTVNIKWKEGREE